MFLVFLTIFIHFPVSFRFLSMSLSFESRRVQGESQDAIGRHTFLELQFANPFHFVFHFKFVALCFGFFGLHLPFVCFWPQGVSCFSTLARKLCHPSMASLPPLDTNWAQRIDAARKRRHTETQLEVKLIMRAMEGAIESH